MSRSKKGKKPPGHDYWGKRGMCDKKTTKRSERTETKKVIKKQVTKEDE